MQGHYFTILPPNAPFTSSNDCLSQPSTRKMIGLSQVWIGPYWFGLNVVNACSTCTYTLTWGPFGLSIWKSMRGPCLVRQHVCATTRNISIRFTCDLFPIHFIGQSMCSNPLPSVNRVIAILPLGPCTFILFSEWKLCGMPVAIPLSVCFNWTG